MGLGFLNEVPTLILIATRPHLLAPDGRFRIPGPWASELARGMSGREGRALGGSKMIRV